MRKAYKLFIFDFDGTLGDTSECIVASFQKTLSQYKLPQANKSEIIKHIGLSLPKVFRTLTKNSLEDALYEKLTTSYRSHYKELLLSKTQIYPEAYDTLNALKEQKIICSIATSKKTEFTKLSCKHLKIDKFISLYVCDDMVSQEKPHPEMLLYTLNALKIDKTKSVMIGDTTYDIEMGNSIGMDTIAVTWGSHSKKLLLSAKPAHIIDSFPQLMKFAS